MKNKLAFGVGCFHFGYRKQAPFTYETSKYIEDVKSALSSLPSLSDLTISFEKSLSSDEHITHESLPLQDGGLFPYVHFLSITFQLFIPARLQDELFPGESMAARIHTETFRVSVKHAFHGPVAFVECLRPTKECDPSSAVQLLREYLRREFRKLSGDVSFECLGPSPFHVDFYVENCLEPNSAIIFNETDRRGYNEITFSCDASLPLSDVLEFIYDELSHELDLYYDIQRRTVQMMRQGDALVADWRQLHERTESHPSVWNLRTRVRMQRAARKLILKAYELQAEFTGEELQVSRDIVETYKKGTARYLERYLRDIADTLPKYPIESVLKWAQHIEEGFFKQAQIVAMVMSALGGGIIGSIATLLSSGRG